MKRLTVMMMMVMALGTVSLAASACGGDPCKDLAAKICADKSVPCDKAEAWVKSMMKGPSGEDMGAEGCKVVLTDAKAAEGYVKAGRKKLTAEKKK